MLSVRGIEATEKLFVIELWILKLKIKHLRDVGDADLHGRLSERLTEADSWTTTPWGHGACMSLLTFRRQVHRICVVKALRQELQRTLPLLRINIKRVNTNLDNVIFLELVFAKASVLSCYHPSALADRWSKAQSFLHHIVAVVHQESLIRVHVLSQEVECGHVGFISIFSDCWLPDLLVKLFAKLLDVTLVLDQVSDDSLHSILRSFDASSQCAKNASYNMFVTEDLFVFKMDT